MVVPTESAQVFFGQSDDSGASPCRPPVLVMMLIKAVMKELVVSFLEVTDPLTNTHSLTHTHTNTQNTTQQTITSLHNISRHDDHVENVADHRRLFLAGDC